MVNLLPPKTPEPITVARAKPSPFTLRHLLAVMALAGLLVLVLIGVGTSLLGPSVGAARRAACQFNLHEIMVALQNYHDVYHRFPPAYVADANGQPMHSWRVLILPFLEHKPLYDAYRFDEPWDGPNNSKLAGDLKILMCPSDGTRGTGQTSYVAVVGRGTAWPRAKCIDLADIRDGVSNTIMVVEVHNSGISWMEPRDLDVSQMPMAINPRVGGKGGLGISSGHSLCAHAARADGSVFVLEEKTPPATIRAMLTIAGRD
ncbi:MAG: DUF1559 domain-containing protein [Planctomycetaceae bacterium]|nr:DUF1559 domain-containing protein [Planctomycetaceae bacterium]